MNTLCSQHRPPRVMYPKFALALVTEGLIALVQRYRGGTSHILVLDSCSLSSIIIGQSLSVGGPTTPKGQLGVLCFIRFHSYGHKYWWCGTPIPTCLRLRSTVSQAARTFFRHKRLTRGGPLGNGFDQKLVKINRGNHRNNYEA